MSRLRRVDNVLRLRRVDNVSCLRCVAGLYVFFLDEAVKGAGCEGQDEGAAADESKGSGVAGRFTADIPQDHEGGEGDEYKGGKIDIRYGGGVTERMDGFSGNKVFFPVAFYHFNDVKGDAAGMIGNMVFEGFKILKAILETFGEYFDQVDDFDALEGRQVDAFKIRKERRLLNFELAGGADDVKMVFELFQGPDAGGRNAGNIVDEQGILLGLCDATKEGNEVFDAISGDPFFDSFRISVVDESAGFFLITFEQSEDGAGQCFLYAGQVIDPEYFGRIFGRKLLDYLGKIIEQVRFSDALRTEQHHINSFQGELGQLQHFCFTTDMAGCQSEGQGSPVGWKPIHRPPAAPPGLGVDGADGPGSRQHIIEERFDICIWRKSHQVAHQGDICSLAQETGPKVAAELLGMDAGAAVVLQSPPDGFARKGGLVVSVAGKQVCLWGRVLQLRPIPGASFQNPGGEGYGTAEFGVVDSQRMALKIKIADAQGGCFRYPQSGIQEEQY